MPSYNFYLAFQKLPKLYSTSVWEGLQLNVLTESAAELGVSVELLTKLCSDHEDVRHSFESEVAERRFDILFGYFVIFYCQTFSEKASKLDVEFRESYLGDLIEEAHKYEEKFNSECLKHQLY